MTTMPSTIKGTTRSGKRPRRTHSGGATGANNLDYSCEDDGGENTGGEGGSSYSSVDRHHRVFPAPTGLPPRTQTRDGQRAVVALATKMHEGMVHSDMVEEMEKHRREQAGWVSTSREELRVRSRQTFRGARPESSQDLRIFWARSQS